MSALAFLLFAAFAATDWVAVSGGHRNVEWITKPAATAALIVYGLAGAAPSAWLVTALTLSLLGDIYLMLPANLFLAGLGAFLLAHVAYIIDFEASTGWRLFWWAILMVASSPVVLRVIGAVRESSLRIGVIVYVAVLGYMAASAIASGSILAAVGAVLFMVSDGIIAWDRFVQRLDWARPGIMITYHLAQLGLVTALRG